MATERTGSGGTRRLVRELSNCSLEILPDKNDKKGPGSRPGSSKSTTSLRGGSGRSGQRAPPIGTATTAAQRRPATPPTKTVTLAAPRHPEPSGTLSADELAQLAEMKKQGQKSSLRKSSPPPLAKQASTDKPLSSSSTATIDSDSSSSAPTTSATDGTSDASETKNQNKSKKYLSKSVEKFQKLEGPEGKAPNSNNANSDAKAGGESAVNIEDSDEFDTDLESGEASSSEEEEEEKRKAPNELMMEFLECVMSKDYENAQKLCRMILLFEPDHPEALKFKQLIEEKIQLEKEKENESSGEEDEGEEDSSDEDDDEDNSNSEDSSNEEDSDEDKEDKEEKEEVAVASTTDKVPST